VAGLSTDAIGPDPVEALFARVYRRTGRHYLESERASADFIAWSIETLLAYNLLGFGSEGGALRVLDGPVYDAWLDPWRRELRGLAVRLRRGYEVTRLEVRDGRIARAQLRTPRRPAVAHADWYVCALPVQRARRLWNPAVLRAAPPLGRMSRLENSDCTGMNFFLNRNAPVARGGYQTVDAPWAPVFLNQAQFFRRSFADSYGDGSVKDCISVALASWHRPGILYGKPVPDCTPDEYAREVWAQMKSHVNKPGEPPRLTDDMLVRWQVDDGIVRRRGKLVNEQPLVIPVVGTRGDRPDVATAIPNLLLAGDYVAGEWEIGHMEAACFAGRRAANAVLDRAGSHEEFAKTIGPYRPPEWEPLKRMDENRWRRGQRNVFDAEMSAEDFRALLARFSPPG
jgi:hypothetical protein